MPKTNRVESKAAVVKRSKSQKRSGFLGTPKWIKDEERKRPKCTSSEITFVPDCADVGSDSNCSQKPLPKSSSKRKIKDIESSSEEEYELKEAKRAERYRFVDMGSLEDLIQRVHAFSENCSTISNKSLNVLATHSFRIYYYCVGIFRLDFIAKILLYIHF